MKTRLFKLTYDRSKTNPRVRDREKISCEGTHYATGIITLDSGAYFNGLFELQEHFKWIGEIDIKYEGEGEI